MRHHIPLLALLMVVGLAAVVAWQALNAPAGGPAGETLRVTAPVERRTLEETVITRGVTGFSATQDLTAATSGRVTAIHVTTGDVVEPGARLLSIDARPTVAVDGQTPFWREIAAGTTGPDVSELQRILADAGHDPGGAAGTFGPETEQALRAWQAELGYAQPDGVLRLSDVVTGSWPQRVGRIQVTVGAFVQPGAALLGLTATDPVVTLQLLPSERLRVEAGDPVRVELSATGASASGTLSEVSSVATTIEDESLVYPALITLDEPLDAPEGTQAQVTIVLSRAENAVVVPLVSLAADGRGGTTVRVVRDDGSVEAVPVEVGVSQAGYVQVVSGLTGSETVLVSGQ